MLGYFLAEMLVLAFQCDLPNTWDVMNSQCVHIVSHPDDIHAKFLVLIPRSGVFLGLRRRLRRSSCLDDIGATAHDHLASQDEQGSQGQRDGALLL